MSDLPDVPDVYLPSRKGKPPQPDHYENLKLRPGATEEEVKNRFRELVRELHPDKNQGNVEAEKRSKRVLAAKTILMDKEARREYDRKRERALSGKASDRRSRSRDRRRRTRSSSSRAARRRGGAKRRRSSSSSTPHRRKKDGKSRRRSSSSSGRGRRAKKTNDSEKRISPVDGKPYTKAEFTSMFKSHSWERASVWTGQTKSRTPPPPGVNIPTGSGKTPPRDMLYAIMQVVTMCGLLRASVGSSREATIIQHLQQVAAEKTIKELYFAFPESPYHGLYQRMVRNSVNAAPPPNMPQPLWKGAAD